jgi:outer membrane protein assembly factor BamB
VFVATKALLGGASLRRMQDDGGLNFAQEVALALNDGAALPVACDVVSVPLAMDAKDATARVLAACANGQLHRVRPDFTASTTGTLVTTLAFEPSESIVILPGGDLLVPGKDSKLHRLAAATGAEAWVAPDLKSPLGGAAVVAPDAAGVVAYATTSTGHLWALDSSGAAVWSTDAVATPLGAGPLGFPTIAPARPGRLPTLLVGDGSGALHAVVVDTGLDTTSPWPKSHRDLRNTGNSAAPLP